jgi:hypothetical protein
MSSSPGLDVSLVESFMSLFKYLKLYKLPISFPVSSIAKKSRGRPADFRVRLPGTIFRKVIDTRGAALLEHFTWKSISATDAEQGFPRTPRATTVWVALGAISMGI